VESVQDSLALIRLAFANDSSPLARKASAIIALNAGAAIYVSGVADSLAEGVKLAEDALSSGGAKTKLQELCEFSACLS